MQSDIDSVAVAVAGYVDDQGRFIPSRMIKNANGPAQLGGIFHIAEHTMESRSPIPFALSVGLYGERHAVLLLNRCSRSGCGGYVAPPAPVGVMYIEQGDGLGWKSVLCAAFYSGGWY